MECSSKSANSDFSTRIATARNTSRRNTKKCKKINQLKNPSPNRDAERKNPKGETKKTSKCTRSQRVYCLEKSRSLGRPGDRIADEEAEGDNSVSEDARKPTAGRLRKPNRFKVKKAEEEENVEEKEVSGDFSGFFFLRESFDEVVTETGESDEKPKESSEGNLLLEVRKSFLVIFCS